ncbi:PTS sugar transporter subunit IIA [Flocculibacter collagenilyticus]|uniref:PTS sugar transporter subunit IIA n=1 Tax=Flocculibacter collagenilyticus TaxID=2744479 RepID=UPI0018F4DF28|nr:glucose PTS transporter subunit IIA [Flocculibacter collagenilyticus]
MQFLEKVVKVDSVNKQKGFFVLAPLSGNVLSLDEVPDPIFQHRVLGDGIAIELSGNQMCSPVNGIITELSNSCDRVQLQSDKGLKILIHIGLGTSTLMGQGFKQLIKEQQKVKAGQPILQYDIRLIQQHASSLLSPVIITNSDKIGSIFCDKQRVTAGEDILFVAAPKTSSVKSKAKREQAK